LAKRTGGVPKMMMGAKAPGRFFSQTIWGSTNVRLGNYALRKALRSFFFGAWYTAISLLAWQRIHDDPNRYMALTLNVSHTIDV